MPDTVKLSTKGVILAKNESAYGTDASPVAGTDAIRVEDPKIEPIVRKITRNYSQSYMGARKQINIGEGLKITFKTEVKGSGAAGTAPEIGPLFRACNFSETITPSTKVEYDPNSLIDSGESLSMYFYLDGILHKALGCRGNVNFEAKAGDIAYLSWEFTGIFAGPADSSNPSPTLNTTLPERFIGASFAIDSYSAVIENLKIDIGNNIAQRKDANAATGIKEWFIKNREVKGNIDPEVPTLATKDFWTMFTSSTEAALSATIGASTGVKCIVTAPKVQLDSLAYGDREGILTHDLPLVLTPNAGNDEVKFDFQ